MPKFGLTGIAVVAAAVSLALAACGSGESTSGSPKTLNVHVIGSGSTIPKQDIIKETLDKKLGIDIKLTSATSPDDYYTQLSASLAGGTAPDLFQVDRSHLQQFVRQGLVMDLTDRLDTDLKVYTKFVGRDSMKGPTFDDKVYGVLKRPQYQYNSIWIRKDWLDKLGLKEPKSVDDLYAVAKAFTEKDPDGNGKRDTYGFTGGKDYQPWGPLWAAFGAGEPDSFYEENGQIVNGFQDPDTKQALSYIRKLMAEKLVDPDVLTGDALQGHQRALQGKAGMIVQDWPHMTKPQFVEQYKTAQPDAKWVQLPPPSGPAGPGAMPTDENGSTIYAIPRSLEGNEEKLRNIFAFIEYISGKEGNRLVSYGVKGVHYNLQGDKVVPTEKLTTEGEYFWLYQLTGRDEGEYLATKFAAQKDYIAFAENQPKLPTFGSLVVEPEGYNAVDADRYAEEQLAQFVSGKRPLSEWDSFVGTLSKQFGYDKYVSSAKDQLKELGATK
ncbi:type 2 periplasmic-binding domain-containing protein [Flindersiella endophytica]